VRLSRRGQWNDVIYAALGKQPHRCRGCHARFYAPESPTAAPASANGASQNREPKRRGRSKRLKRRFIEAAVFSVLLIIFLFVLNYLTRPPAS
jgi:hypothetical protein